MFDPSEHFSHSNITCNTQRFTQLSFTSTVQWRFSYPARPWSKLHISSGRWELRARRHRPCYRPGPWTRRRFPRSDSQPEDTERRFNQNKLTSEFLFLLYSVCEWCHSRCRSSRWWPTGWPPSTPESRRCACRRSKRWPWSRRSVWDSSRPEWWRRRRSSAWWCRRERWESLHHR